MMNKFVLCFSLVLLVSCAKQENGPALDSLSDSSSRMNATSSAGTADSTHSTAQPSNTKTESATVIKVFVSQSDEITANGIPVTLARLDAMFKKLRGHKTGVLYSRGDGHREPSDIALSIMELIAKYRLPMQLYTDSTFTVPIKN